MPDTTLNPEQKEAIEHGDGPLLIIAGAGTGKTTVVTKRIEHLLINRKISPQNVLALTFTEKAAREMEERIDIAMPYGYTQMWIATFHSFCDRILRNEAVHIGLDPSYRLMTEAESILFLRQHIFSFSLDYFRPLGNPYKFLGGMLQHFSRLKDEDISPNAYLAWIQKQDTDEIETKKNKELARAYKTYEDLKAKEGKMDFSDLISNTLKLFRERPNILTQYQEQFHYVLVDEFQDTNFAQNTLAILLAGEKQNITVVGDDDQAIYRWRGAAISNMIQFRTQFPAAKVVTLTQNYRSAQSILDTSYKVIQNNNPDRLEVKEHIDKKLHAARSIKGNPVELLYAGRVEDEAEAVTQKIIELVDKEKNTWKDFAILVRANDHAQPFMRSLQRANIPFQFLGPGRLFRQEEIKELVSYLKVLANFDDSLSLYHVLASPIFKIEGRDIAALLNFAKKTNNTLFETIEKLSREETADIFLAPESLEKVTTIYQMIRRHLDLVPKETAGQILYYFLQDTGLIKKYLAAETDTDIKAYQNIAKLFDKLKTFEATRADASVFAIVEWIDLSMQMGESPLASDNDWGDIDAVNLLTIHASKGLEFPVVFLTNLVSQRFPTRERQEQIPIPQEMIKEILPEGDHHLQEERRLFYVGMTRARDHLYLTAANFYGEGKRDRKLSPFVYETLGETFVKEITMKQSSNQAMHQLALLDWAPVEESKVTSRESPVSRPITYLSYSQIQTFAMCHLHYKLRYILKLPSKYSSAQAFGTSLHAALRDIYQSALSGEKISDASIKQLLEKNWMAEGYESKLHEENARKKAEGLLITYMQKYFDPKHLPIALETPFQFYIKDPTRKTGVKIGGRIDRIDQLDDHRIEIIDYKTGTNMPDIKKLATDLQLTVYALAATEVRDKLLGKKPEEVVLSLYYLETDTKLTTTRTREQLDEAKIELLEKADEIATSDFLCTGGTFCLNCEYKMLCL